MTKTILVIGKNGQLGNSLQKILKNLQLFFNNSSKNYNALFDLSKNDLGFTFVSRNELDLSIPDSIKEFFHQNWQFSGIINCAAYTAVDKAESNEGLAEQINCLAIGQLAEIAKNKAIPLIHISTDYVFNGQANKPYIETDETDPINVYGLTKLKGEKVLKESGCSGAIIRTSWLYSEFGNNFVKTMLSLARKQESVDVVNDQIGGPTYALNLAKVLLLIHYNRQTNEIMNSKLNLFHFTDEGFCSRFDFVKTIFELSKLNCIVNPVKTKDYFSQAKRPYYNVMSNAKIKKYLPYLEVYNWRESLISCLTELKKYKV